MLGRKRAPAAAAVDPETVRAVVDRVLPADGPLAVTAARLARELGVDAGALVDVDVDVVLADSYRALGVAELAEVKRTILANPSPVEQMRSLLSWLSTAPEEGDAIRLEAWALARHNPHLRQVVQDGEAAWHGLVASVVRRGARSGYFVDADAEEIAAHLISLIDGINAYQLIGYRSDLDRMRLLTRVVQSELGLAWGPALQDALA